MCLNVITGSSFFISSLQHGVRQFLGILVHGVLSQCGLPMWIAVSEPQIFLAKLFGMRFVRNRVLDEINCPPLTYLHCPPLTYRTLPTPDLQYIGHPWVIAHCPPLTYRTLSTPNLPYIAHPSLTVHCLPLSYRTLTTPQIPYIAHVRTFLLASNYPTCQM